MLVLAQAVAVVLTLSNAQGVTLVSNPSRTTQQISVALFYGEVQTQADGVKYVKLGREVRAIVAPASFTLAPGEAQTVRLKLREVVPAGTVLRLVTTFEPQHADGQHNNAAPVTTTLTMVTRFISKVVVQQ